MKVLSMLLLSFAAAALFTAKAQDTADAEKTSVSQLITSRNYSFQAQYAIPLNGREIPLTTEYMLTVKGDTLISYLPYYGRAFVAPINPQDAGIAFTSTDFEYTATKTKKDRYDITIKPNHESKASQLMLSVQKSGYATLQVISVNRQQITFRGIIINKTDRKKD